MADIDTTMNDNTAFISLPSWYLDKIHRRLTVVLQESFRPLSDYLEELRLRFGCVIYKRDRDAMVASMNAGTERSFEECVAKVEDLNQLVRVVNKMVHNSLSILLILL